MTSKKNLAIVASRVLARHWCAFFHRTVDLRGQEQAMPVNDLWSIGQVSDLYDLLLTLAHTQKRTWNLAAISYGLEASLWKNF